MRKKTKSNAAGSEVGARGNQAQRVELPGTSGGSGLASNVESVRSAGRRRLLQAGISASPVVMTVLSRPVLAQTGQFCQSPSGFVSGNLSHTQTGPGCMGRQPDYWLHNPTLWPPPPKGYTTDTLFKTVFTPDFNSPNNEKTLLFWLDSNNGGDGFPYKVARLCIAAVLNVASGNIPPTVLTKDMIQHMWSEYSTTHGYHPGQVTGAGWNEAELIDYLLRIMPLPG